MTCFRIGNKTVLQWCKENGACYSAFWTAMERGYTLEKALEKALGSHTGYKYYYKGVPIAVLFKNDRKAYYRVKSRMRNGADPIKTVETELNRTLPPQKANKPRYFYNGKSLVELFGAGTGKYQRILKRMREGMSINNAVSAEGVL